MQNRFDVSGPSHNTCLSRGFLRPRLQGHRNLPDALNTKALPRPIDILWRRNRKSFRAQLDQGQHRQESYASRLDAILAGVSTGQITASTAVAELKAFSTEPSAKLLSLEALQGAYEVVFTDSPFLSRRSFPLRVLGADLPNLEMATGPLHCDFIGEVCHEWSRTTVSLIDGQPPLRSSMSLVSRVQEVCADHFTLDHLEMRLWCDETEPTRKRIWQHCLGQGEPMRITAMPRPGMVTRADWFDGQILVGGFGQFTTVLRRVAETR